MWQICWENLDQNSFEKVHLPAYTSVFRQSVHAPLFESCPSISTAFVFYVKYTVHVSCWCHLPQKMIPCSKLTWQQKMDLVKMYLLFKTGDFNCHVSSPEGKPGWKIVSTQLSPTHPPKLWPPICQVSSCFVWSILGTLSDWTSRDVSSYPTSPSHQAAIFFHLAKFCNSFKSTKRKDAAPKWMYLNYFKLSQIIIMPSLKLTVRHLKMGNLKGN